MRGEEDVHTGKDNDGNDVDHVGLGDNS